ncbi:MAG: hypothetical protein ACR2LQ_04960 [Acidimicrobiales bacterium]
MNPRDRRERFGRPDLIGPFVLNLAGIVLIVLAWIATSGRDQVGEQIAYVNLAVGGAILTGTGNAVLLNGYRRAVRSRREAIATHPRVQRALSSLGRVEP